MKTQIILIAASLILALFTQASQAETADFPQKASTDTLSVFAPLDTWFLPAGHEIKATIQNAIFSFNLQTPVIAVLDESALCPRDGRVILPKKTRLLGTADILKSDDRVNIRFTIAVLPNGREFELNGIALSPDGSAGIKGTVKEYKDARFMSSALSGAMGGMGQAIATTLPGQPLVAGAIGGALSQGAQEAQTISNQKVDVSISVPPFQKTHVFLSHRLSLDGLLRKEQDGQIDAERKKKDEDKAKDWKKE